MEQLARLRRSSDEFKEGKGAGSRFSERYQSDCVCIMCLYLGDGSDMHEAMRSERNQAADIGVRLR
jgi:hypothetical protein